MMVGFIALGSIGFLSLFGSFFITLIRENTASNARSANLQQEFPLTKVADGTFAYDPVFTDVNGDGKLELIAGSTAEISCYREVDGKYQFARSIYAIKSGEDHIQGMQVKSPGVLLVIEPHAVYEIDLPESACQA
ncbi:MAG: hypothetical protein ACYDGX_03930 [Thermoleophilia bacterium]